MTNFTSGLPVVAGAESQNGVCFGENDRFTACDKNIVKLKKTGFGKKRCSNRHITIKRVLERVDPLNFGRGLQKTLRDDRRGVIHQLDLI
jgi:hypothetical protein